MLETQNESEKRRLKNLNNSLLQRLKRRKDEEVDKEFKIQLKEKINYTIDILEDELTSKQQQSVLTKLKEKSKDEFKDMGDKINGQQFNKLMKEYLDIDKKVEYESMTEIKQ